MLLWISSLFSSVQCRVEDAVSFMKYHPTRTMNIEGARVELSFSKGLPSDAKKAPKAEYADWLCPKVRFTAVVVV